MLNVAEYVLNGGRFVYSLPCTRLQNLNVSPLMSRSLESRGWCMSRSLVSRGRCMSVSLVPRGSCMSVSLVSRGNRDVENFFSMSDIQSDKL